MKKLSVLVVAGLAISTIALSSCERRVRSAKQVAAEKAELKAKEDADKAAEEAAKKAAATTPATDAVAPAPLSKEAYELDVQNLAAVLPQIQNDVDAEDKAAFVVLDKSVEGAAPAYALNVEGLKNALRRKEAATASGTDADAYIASKLASLDAAHKSFVKQYDGKDVVDASNTITREQVQFEVEKSKAMIVAIEAAVKELALEEEVYGTQQ